jgi:hypothetical protein
MWAVDAYLLEQRAIGLENAALDAELGRSVDSRAALMVKLSEEDVDALVAAAQQQLRLQVEARRGEGEGGGAATSQQEHGELQALTPSSTLRVCPKFIKHECSLSTCSLAHPGLRDSAEIVYSRLRNGRKRAFVRLCLVREARCRVARRGLTARRTTWRLAGAARSTAVSATTSMFALQQMPSFASCTQCPLGGA